MSISKLSLAVLCVLGLCALSFSMPAPSTSGRRLNGGRTQNARSTKRQAAAPPVHTIPQNVTGKFLLDLYNNFTNSSVPEKIEANTIRSLTYHPETSECGVFNFTVSVINSSEFLLQAELHLYLPNTPQQHPGEYRVQVTLTLPDGGQLNQTVQRVNLTAKGYVILDVLQIATELIERGEPHALFKVKIFKELSGVKCQDFEFISNADLNEDNTPIFVVYSYNPLIERITYGMIAENVRKTIVDSRTAEGPSTVEQNSRRKRATQHCTVHPLNVPGNTIFNSMVGSDAKEFFVKYPMQYNAGICGGSCALAQPPSGVHANHAPLVALLAERKAFDEEYDYTFIRTCVPVKYRPLAVLSVSDGVPTFNVIQNMIIEKCECLDIIKL